MKAEGESADFAVSPRKIQHFFALSVSFPATRRRIIAQYE
jgi:hypothetical protein